MIQASRLDLSMLTNQWLSIYTDQYIVEFGMDMFLIYVLLRFYGTISTVLLIIMTFLIYTEIIYLFIYSPL